MPGFIEIDTHFRKFRIHFKISFSSHSAWFSAGSFTKMFKDNMKEFRDLPSVPQSHKNEGNRVPRIFTDTEYCIIRYYVDEADRELNREAVARRMSFNIFNIVSQAHLADLVQWILSISIRVLKVVMCGECAVDIPGDDTFLGWVLQHTWITWVRQIIIVKKNNNNTFIRTPHKQ